MAELICDLLVSFGPMGPSPCHAVGAVTFRLACGFGIPRMVQEVVLLCMECAEAGKSGKTPADQSSSEGADEKEDPPGSAVVLLWMAGLAPK